MWRLLGPAWPLKALCLGLPLWWALGLGVLIFPLAALAMLIQLTRRRWIRIPFGTSLLVLFMIWMVIGGLLLWAPAPGTITGGGPERLIGYGFRAMWYVSILIVFVYTVNISQRISALTVMRWLAFIFIVAITMGFAAMVAPRFEFTSLMEHLIPARGNNFIKNLTHPALAIGSDFLGYEQARPKAPFAFSNTWGNNVGLLMPVYAYVVATAPRLRWRVLGTAFGLASLAPIVYSLNRGLWLGLAVLAVYAGYILVRQRRVVLFWALSALGITGLIGLLLSPVGQTMLLRLRTPHSNERRGTVAEVVLTTTLQGSPLLGFGTTRQVAGNFASLAGGATATCHQCGAPPLGTQGHMWLLVFTTGFVGTALFLGFFAVQFLRHAQLMNPPSLIGCISIVLSALFFLVYDSLDSPLFITMVLIGLMNRERLLRRTARTGRDIAPVFRGRMRVEDDPMLALLRVTRLTYLGLAVGLALGGVVYLLTPTTYTAKATLELPATPPQVDLNRTAPPIKPLTLDTEAQLILSDPVVDNVSLALDTDPATVRANIGVSAIPLTRVLEVTYTDGDAERALAGARSVANTFVAERDQVYLAPQRDYLNEILGKTEAAHTTQTETVKISEDQPRTEALRQAAVASQLRLPGQANVIIAPRLSESAYRGDLLVPLVSGAAFGALMGTLISLARSATWTRGWFGLPRIALSWSERVGHGRRRRKVLLIDSDYRRHALIYMAVIGILGALIAGTAGALATRTSFIGTTTVLLNPLPGNGFARRGSIQSDETQLSTEAALVSSDEVLRRVSDQTGVEVPVLRRRVSAEANSAAEAIFISYRARTEGQAEQMSRAVADSVLQVRQARVQSAFLRRTSILDVDIAQAQAVLESALKPGGPRAQVGAFNARLADLRAERAAIEDVVPHAGTIVADEVSLSRRSQLQPLIAALGGLMIGLPLGYLYHRLRLPKRVRRVTW